jgi:hypothetical protein
MPPLSYPDGERADNVPNEVTIHRTGDPITTVASFNNHRLDPDREYRSVSAGIWGKRRKIGFPKILYMCYASRNNLWDDREMGCILVREVRDDTLIEAVWILTTKGRGATCEAILSFGK